MSLHQAPAAAITRCPSPAALVCCPTALVYCPPLIVAHTRTAALLSTLKVSHSRIAALLSKSLTLARAHSCHTALALFCSHMFCQQVELGVVIGKTARHVTAENAMDYVSGYCLALDMTDRDGQNKAKEGGKPWTQVPHKLSRCLIHSGNASYTLTQCLIHSGNGSRCLSTPHTASVTSSLSIALTLSALPDTLSQHCLTHTLSAALSLSMPQKYTPHYLLLAVLQQ